MIQPAEQKPWGFKVLVSDDGQGNRVERLFVAPGGFCSLHYHEKQTHSLALEWGSAVVESDSGGGDESFDLGLGHVGVNPCDLHRFRAGPFGAVIRETIQNYEEGDIVRHVPGGIGES